MMLRSASTATLPVLRRLLLALLVFGMAGTVTELLLLAHFEDGWQLIPIVLIGLSMVTAGWHAWIGGRTSVLVLRGMMVLMLFAGALGLALHYQSNMAFQLDMDPSQSGWQLFQKVIRAQAPPALAPGVMAQLGLLGLAYAYRHPALLSAPGPKTSEGE